MQTFEEYLNERDWSSDVDNSMSMMHNFVHSTPPDKKGAKRIWMLPGGAVITKSGDSVELKIKGKVKGSYVWDRKAANFSQPDFSITSKELTKLFQGYSK